MRKIVGKLTPEERNEIRRLFERRSGLNELIKILTVDNDELYERVVADMGATSIKFDKWWNTMVEKYDWESAEDGRWEVDFDDCSIYLVTEE